MLLQEQRLKEMFNLKIQQFRSAIVQVMSMCAGMWVRNSSRPCAPLPQRLGLSSLGKVRL